MPVFSKRYFSPCADGQLRCRPGSFVADDSGIVVGVWQMSESSAELYERYPALEQYRPMVETKYRSERRRVEFLCVRQLLAELLGHPVVVNYAASGQPLLDGWQVSITHTYGYAAVVLSRSLRVGIDAERTSERVEKVARRFVRPDEEAVGSEALTVLWTIKETVYKLFSEQQLGFSDIRAAMPSGEQLSAMWRAASPQPIAVENLRTGQPLFVWSELVGDCVLTFSSLS